MRAGTRQSRRHELTEISPICSLSLPTRGEAHEHMVGDRGRRGRGAHAFSLIADTMGWSAATSTKRRCVTSCTPFSERFWLV